MSVDDIVNGIYGYLDTNGEANYIGMLEGLGIVGEIAGAIIHILVALIIIILPITVAIEVCYINFPAFQVKYEQLYNKLVKGQNILGLTIRDARAAVELSATTEYEKSANWIYFKRKCKIIFLSVFVISLELGPGLYIIKILFSFVQRFIGVIRGLM